MSSVNDYVYIITTIAEPDAKNRSPDRSWAWFKSFDEAEHSLTNYPVGYEDCAYRYAVIEKVPDGAMPIALDSIWYRFVDIETMEEQPRPDCVWTCKVERIEQPAWAKHILNFCLG